MSDEMYVCGGIYREKNGFCSQTGAQLWKDRFGLVSPSGANAKPYVARGMENARKLFRLCSHSSNLYRISPDDKTLRLVETGDTTGKVGSPGDYIIDDPGLRKRLRSGISDPWMYQALPVANENASTP